MDLKTEINMSSLVEEAAFTRRAEQGDAACKTTVSPSFTEMWL